LNFKDYFSRQSAEYSKYRPVYPHSLIDFIASQCNRTERAWDCATGTGQAALMLTAYFNEIIATDASEQQIIAATVHPRITYRICTAESPDLPDDFFDLITVAQAIHWFNQEKFYTAAARVAKPGAVLAVWGYSNHSISKKIDDIIHVLYCDILKDYWPRERILIERCYNDIELPFQKIAHPAFLMHQQMNLYQLTGYLFTWSAVQLFIQKNGFNPLQYILDDLLQAWGNAETTRVVTWPVHLKLARILK
jgi:SAM-dependent methyltransferase